MAIYRYDEASNIAQLRAFPRRFKVLFALLAATRVLPMYRRFASDTGRGDVAALQGLAQGLWQDILDQSMIDAEALAGAHQALVLVPLEEDGWDEETQAYAEDAAAALAYAYRARVGDDAQEAAWAARRVYEAADRFVVAMGSLPVGGTANEENALYHSLVQAELARQKRDLRELAELMGSGAIDERIAELRARSESEAASFFGPAAV